MPDPQLLPVAVREEIQAQVVHATARLEEFINREVLSQLPPDRAIPLGQGYCLTNEGIAWDNRYRAIGGKSLPHFVTVPPTHYQAVVLAFALTQKKLDFVAIFSRIING